MLKGRYIRSLLADDKESRKGYEKFLHDNSAACDFFNGDRLRQGRSDRQIEDDFLTAVFQHILSPKESPRLECLATRFTYTQHLKRSSSFSSDAGDTFAPQGTAIPAQQQRSIAAIRATLIGRYVPRSFSDSFDGEEALVGASERAFNIPKLDPSLMFKIPLSISHDSIAGIAHTGQRPPLAPGDKVRHKRYLSADLSNAGPLLVDSNRPPHKRQSSIDLLAQPPQVPVRSSSGDLSRMASLETSADGIRTPGPSPQSSPRKAGLSPRIPPRPLASPRR